ncbi:serine protease [Bremerella sp. JC817]|uniref:S1C family serine protease n=1 Tax=Bremerella sp. JC817 TaxID=3231756 RepID=UPI0034578010
MFWKRLALLALLVTASAIGCNTDVSPDGSNSGGLPLFGRKGNGSGGALSSFADQPAYQIRPTELQYSLVPTRKMTYKIQTVLTLPDKEQYHGGKISYEVSTGDPNRLLEIKDGESTGTAFVVHPDGFLVTCAHVVQGAVNVDVHLGGKTYIAKVVDLDTRNDLALIRIDAHNMPALPIIDSSTIRLAEEVRVVGFPLTDVLGESLKIARGTVSGINEGKPDQMFQLDATVNPGNSGGPVVDEKGQVTSVASELLSGDGVSNVGFAVPSNLVTAMLARNNISFTAGSSSAPQLSGPDLAEHVKPSIALMKVRTGPKGVGSSDNRLVLFSFFVSEQTKTGNLYRDIRGTTKQESGRLVLNPFGETQYDDGIETLPLFVRELSTIAFEPLPRFTSDTWETSSVRIVPQKKNSKLVIEEDPRMAELARMNPLLRGRLPYGFNPKVKEVSSYEFHPAIEQATYRVKSRVTKDIAVEKTHDLKTVQKDQAIPFLHLKGKAHMVFSTRSGVYSSIDYEGTADITVDGKTLTIPIKYSCSLVEDRPSYLDQTAPSNRPSSTTPSSSAPYSPDDSPKTSGRVSRPEKRRYTEELPKVKGLSQLDLSR